MQDPVDSLPDESLPISDIKRQSLDKDDFGDVLSEYELNIGKAR